MHKTEHGVTPKILVILGERIINVRVSIVGSYSYENPNKNCIDTKLPYT